MSKIYQNVCFVGKFSPFHVGHISQIDYLSGLAETVYTISCETRDSFSELDFSAFQNMFPNVTLLSAKTKNLHDLILSLKIDTLFYGDPTNDAYLLLKEQFPHLQFVRLLKKHLDLSNARKGGVFKPSKDRTQDAVVRFRQIINKIGSKSNILVIGDPILDVYVRGAVDGISAEEPLIVFSPQDEIQFLGGGLAVARNFSEFFDNVTYVSGVDPDTLKINIKSDAPFQRDFFPTTKYRYQVSNRTIFKMTDNRGSQYTDEYFQVLSDWLSENIGRFSIVTVSDFALGLLNASIAQLIVKCCCNWSIPLLIDAQNSSKVASLNKYKDAPFFFQTVRELSVITTEAAGLVQMYDEAMRTLNAKRIFLKLGEHGVFTRDENNREVQLRALNRDLVDSSGAGDAMLVGSAIGILGGVTVEEILSFGQIFSAVQCSRLSNVPITISDIEQFARH